jgi:hypothetical protein
MSKEHKPHPSVDKLLQAPWSPQSLIDWLSHYGKPLLLAVVLLLLAIPVIYRMASVNSGQQTQDYLQADRAFERFTQPISANGDMQIQKEALKELHTLLDRTPTLHPKYDGLVAQILLNRGEIDSALEYANLAMTRTLSANRPFYKEYAQISFTVGKKEYDQALQQATLLQQSMREHLADTPRPFGNVLFAFNLLRIGMLQQQLGLKKEEQQTWREWQQFMGAHQDPQLMETIASLSEGNLSLINYIELRQKQLP